MSSIYIFTNAQTHIHTNTLTRSHAHTYNMLDCCNTLQRIHTVTHCNTYKLQHTATHTPCNTLQHIHLATYCNTLQLTPYAEPDGWQTTKSGITVHVDASKCKFKNIQPRPVWMTSLKVCVCVRVCVCVCARVTHDAMSHT